MFTWSKKGNSRPKTRGESSEENEFGIKLDKGPSDKQLEAELKALAGVDAFPEDNINMNVGEEDEESELLRLIGAKPKKTGRKPAGQDDTSSTDVLGDITAEIDLGEEDVEIDENDPDLLNELLELTEEGGGNDIEEEEISEYKPEEQQPSNGKSDIISVLKERIKMYKTAETKAKENNESSRARRFNRGLKTLEDLIKKAKAGKSISEGDIPPMIALNLQPAPPLQTIVRDEENDKTGNKQTNANETANTNSENQNINDQQASTPENERDDMSVLMERLKMYQAAEWKAKEAGEITRARRFGRGINAIENLIQQAKKGTKIDPTEIPPEVAMNLKPAPPPQAQTPDSENLENEINAVNLDDEEDHSEETTKESVDAEKNILEVLSERLTIYKAAEEKAKEAGESTRARRFNRGIKTLNELIRKTNAGGTVSQDEIPPPIALNLKPQVVVMQEDELRNAAIETDNLTQSSDVPKPEPIKFKSPDDDDDFDDWDIDEVLLEEEMPTTVMEGLEQRLRIYRKILQKAQNEGNAAAAKQNERIVEIYKSAIRTFKNGGFVDVLKLPAPKGCPPIPIPFHIP